MEIDPAYMCALRFCNTSIPCLTMVQSDFTLGKRHRATSERKHSFSIIVGVVVNSICVIVNFILDTNAIAVLIVVILIVINNQYCSSYLFVNFVFFVQKVMINFQIITVGQGRQRC